MNLKSQVPSTSELQLNLACNTTNFPGEEAEEVRAQPQGLTPQSSVCSSSRTSFFLVGASCRKSFWEKASLERLISRLASRQVTLYATRSDSACVLRHRRSRRLRFASAAHGDSHLADRLPVRKRSAKWLSPRADDAKRRRWRLERYTL